MDEIEAAVAVSAAPTSALAFDLLDDLKAQQDRRDLVAAGILADAACGAAVGVVTTLAERIRTGMGMITDWQLVDDSGPVPPDWWTLLDQLQVEHATAIEALVAAEFARLEASWALSAHDASRTPPADTEPGEPSALAVRLIGAVVRRYGEIGCEETPAVRAALDAIDAAGPGWDVTNLKAACKTILLVALHAKHGATS